MIVTDGIIGDVLKASLVQSLGADCGTAAAIARSLLAAGTSRPIDVRTLADHGLRAVEHAVADFEERGGLVRDCRERLVVRSSLPRTVPSFLEGAVATHRLLSSDGRASAAVTMPIAPGEIARMLPPLGVTNAPLKPTAETLGRVAAAAIASLTIMTPFLTREGLRW